MSRRLICARTCPARACLELIDGAAAAQPTAGPLAADPRGARRGGGARRARPAAARRERVLTARRLRIARRDVAAAEAQLGARLRQLYEQGETDPLAVLLGAQSLDAALAGLDALDRSASLDRQLIQETRHARAHQRAVPTSLAARSATLA